MKQKLAIIASVISIIGYLSVTVRCQAQQALWSNYSVKFINQSYTPLAGATVISPDDFFDSSGKADHDNGTANNIPVIFSFDYNGMTANTINANINGWVSINPLNDTDPIPSVSSNNNFLFSSDLPNNTLAPYWGDHYYRSIESGYTPSRISYEIISYDDTNPNSPPFSQLRIFYLEWSNLNINDKSNPNSIASFQFIIHENPKGNDLTSPDERATFEFRYGTADTSAAIAGAAVGSDDSTGSSHLNALFATSQFNGDSTRLSKSLTTCWPPPSCTPGIAIQIVPLPANSRVPMPVASSGLSITAFPNPLSQSTTITFSSPESGAAEVTIVNLLGTEIKRIFSGELSSGEHQFSWDASGLPPGMYECVVRMNGHTEHIPTLISR